MDLGLAPFSNCTCNHSHQRTTKTQHSTASLYVPTFKVFRNITPFLAFNSIFILKKTESRSLHCLLKPKPAPIRPPSLLDPHPLPQLLPSVVNFDPDRFCDQLEYYVIAKDYKEALELFENVPGYIKIRPNTYNALIDACIALSSRRYAKLLVTRYLAEYVSGSDSGSSFGTNSNFNIYLYNRFIFLFIKCGLIDRAYRLFDEMPKKNATSYNMMLSGFVFFRKYLETIKLFLQIWKGRPEWRPQMFVSVVSACAGLPIEFLGHQLHAILAKKSYFNNNSFILCALMDMYAKCGCIENAQKIFDLMPEKIPVGWNTMIAGFAFNGLSEEALDLYNEMKSARVRMDKFTYSVIIMVCARLGSIEQGKEAHASLLRNGFALDLVMATALVDLYGKWGKMEDACSVFDQMPRKNVITWNALIGGYAYHGMGSMAMKVFDRMVKEGFVPNHVTFLALLVGCAYSGMLRKGMSIFENMKREYNVKPRAMHYACIVDMLGREGLLQEALDFIQQAPCAPTRNMWAALLRASRAHENVELGLYAAERLSCMDSRKISNYVVLLNLYLSKGRIQDAKRIVDALTEQGLELSVSYTWIEVKKKPYQFFTGDMSHPQSSRIYEKIGALMQEIEKSVPAGEIVNCVLPDVSEHELTAHRYHHSEKLAVAFGLINTPEFTPLQLVQPHRICEHCHAFIELVGLITQRDIVVRDASRFHHFSEGKCSCWGYW